MSRFIRWQGVFAFIAIIILISAFVYVFADNIAKRVIIYSAEKSIGAEVNINEVSLHYFPTGISIVDMAATDPKQPDVNLFNYKKLVAKFDLWAYLQGSILIEDLVVEDLRFAQQRATEGKVYKREQSKAEKSEQAQREAGDDGFALKSPELPDVKTLLADSNLLTVQRSQALALNYESEKKQVLALKSQLPDKAKLAQYEAQVNALTKRKVKSLDDITAAAEELKTLKKAFETDKKLVASAKKQLQESQKVLSEQLTQLRNAPEQDWQNIEEKYQLDKIDAADFAHILFGEQARKYTQYTTKAWQYIAPFVSNLQSKTDDEVVKPLPVEGGRYVYFEDKDALPSFLIKQGVLSVFVEGKQYQISLQDITHQHWLIQSPSELEMSLVDEEHNDFTGLKELPSAMLNYQFELSQAGSFTGKGRWNVAHLPLSDIVLQDSSRLSLTLTQGKLSLMGALSQENTLIESQNDIRLKQLHYKGEASSYITQVLLDTVKDAATLDLSVGIEGEISQPTIKIDSPINQMISDAVQTQITTKLSTFKEQVQSGLQDKVLGAEQESDKANLDIKAFEKLLNTTDGSLDNLLDTQIADSHKEKVKEKLKNKWDKLLGK